MVIVVDMIIVGLGVMLWISLVEDSSLDLVDGGVKVDEYFNISDLVIWFVGDIVFYLDYILGW